MGKYIITLSIIFNFYTNAICRNQGDPIQKIRIDSIQIRNNWRTKESIIRAELGFRVGDSIHPSALDTMVIRIWNIGNFAKVGYELDTLDNGNYFLKVMAKDAFTVVPVLSFSGNRQDWSLGLGMSDDNFLGRNINFSINGTIGTNDKNFSARVTIPRQLLYKNMAISGGILYGQGKDMRYENGERVSGVAYTKMQVSGGISNPWNEDFHYRFSPDFSWSLFQHHADSSLFEQEVAVADNYKVNYLSLSVGESIGYIKRKRHQKDGFRASLGVGAGIGLDKHSPFYYSIASGINYYKLFNKVVQFSSEFSTGYTSSTTPSLLFYKGAGDVKGILTGEISGQAYYATYLGFAFTYINRDWFAMEQSVYVNWGNGADIYFDLYNTKPHYGVGTGFFFNIPMIPWLSMRMYFTYSGKSSNWFRLEI